MNAITKNWQPTLAGAATALGTYLASQPDPWHSIGLALAALGALALGVSAKQWNVTGGSVPQTSEALNRVTMLPGSSIGAQPPGAGGYVRIGALGALGAVAWAAFLAFALASCTTMKGASGTASVTTASGATVTVVAGNGSECISDSHWLPLPGTNLECNSICATQVPSAVTVSVPCRLKDQPTTVVMIQFPIPTAAQPTKPPGQ